MIHKFTGVDPGLVHTGVVVFRLAPDARRWGVQSTAIAGLDIQELARFLGEEAPYGPIFVEAYRPRSHFSTDQQMVEGMGRIRKINNQITVLNNTGVKAVVKPGLLSLMNAWNFSLSTHHQDLRSAARIGVLGALKDERLNQVLTNFVTDHLDGRYWNYI